MYIEYINTNVNLSNIILFEDRNETSQSDKKCDYINKNQTKWKQRRKPHKYRFKTRLVCIDSGVKNNTEKNKDDSGDFIFKFA